MISLNLKRRTIGNSSLKILARPYYTLIKPDIYIEHNAIIFDDKVIFLIMVIHCKLFIKNNTFLWEI